ncbi:division cycle 123 protein [Colletotrichum incanum]|uniref:Division cycle 123 protein n=1 Tax=Colletotrichum incanum TaxID=1573173 RepID=A0A166LYA1_COLIC|nr:division cycle 123 protein [Colletotrichum incanum]
MYRYEDIRSLDHLSEWRCYVYKNAMVAVSQSKFYQPNHAGITNEALRLLVAQACRLWSDISSEVEFESYVLDVYAEVRKPNFEVKLIEINPWGSHFGSGSLLFHWLDDTEILEPHKPNGATVVRLVEGGESPVLTRNEAYRIGREGIGENELGCLQDRGLEWVLEDVTHAKFMALPLLDRNSGFTTRKDELELFLHQRDGGPAKVLLRDHPRFAKLKKAYEAAVGDQKE